MNLIYNYECILSILIENQSNILTRLVGLFSRRGFTIESLTLGSSEYSNLSRIMITFLGNMSLTNQLIRQVYKLLAVVKIDNLTTIPKIIRELNLIKIFVNKKERKEILEIADIFKLEILDFTSRTLTIQIVGNPKKIYAIEQLLNKFEIIEKISTGKIGLIQESTTNANFYKVEQEKTRVKIMNTYTGILEN